MKNQYFGDINDYCKYGLLRGLAAVGLRIGVCWLLTPDDGEGGGELRAYLKKPSRWRKYDSDLYDWLVALQQDGAEHSVRYAAHWELVPGATYFDHVLRDSTESRDQYFNEARQALGMCDVIFFDPDNGIEVPSVPRGKRGSAQYVYWGELREAYGNGHSLVVYQHFPRVDRGRFVPFLADRLQEELGAKQVAAFATPHVAFFLAQQPAHAGALARAAVAVKSKWYGQIEVWPSVSPAV